jgi:uncharacterized protein
LWHGYSWTNSTSLPFCGKTKRPCARGVRHAALFGSHARGDRLPGSDIDIMIEIDPDVLVDLFGYIAIKQYLADLFPNRVDVANRSQLKALVRPSAEQQAIYAF